MSDSSFNVLYESGQTKVVQMTNKTIVWYMQSIDVFGNKFWQVLRIVDSPAEYSAQCEVFKVKQ